MSKGVPRARAEPSTLVELLRQRATQQPEERAYTFLIDGEEQEAHVTYADLDRQARAVGAMLQGCGAGGGRALLLYPPGLEFIAAFFGCLYAAVIGIPAPLPRLGRSDRVLSRLRAIANDAQPMVALTTSRVLAAIKDPLAQVPELSGRRWLTTDNMASDLMEEWWAPKVDRSTLAYLQYTSGSTAAPKGVMVSHGNLWQSQQMIRGSFGHSTETVFVGWLPHYHDMGLVGNILQPLYLGCRCVLMSPLVFLQRPYRWLRAISRYRATTSGGPNFAYDLCVRKISPSQRSHLDLRSWRVAFNGAEPVRSETLARFSAAFAPHGFDPDAFHPVYGLAEATLLASGGRNGSTRGVSIVKTAALERTQLVDAAAEKDDPSGVVSCGRPAPGQEIVIAEPETAIRRPPGRIGEVWLSGPNVAEGYWNQPEETKRTFQACLANTGEGPFVRTGDLGFLRDGELFVTGRLKDLIIIRGQNYYPQDIEWTVQESHPSLRPWCCAAFSVRVAGEERLVVMAEVEPHYRLDRSRRDVARGFDAELRRPLDVDTVVGTIREAVSEQYGLHVHAVLLVEAGTILKTSSGKIQRHACRAAFEAGTPIVVGNVSNEQEIYEK
jgi:acyl-CoA synthetase (AMP-forming)/AMP-acid ligase II